MTFIWLLAWMLKGTPTLLFSKAPNNWAVALIVCLVIDLVIK